MPGRRNSCSTRTPSRAGLLCDRGSSAPRIRASAMSTAAERAAAATRPSRKTGCPRTGARNRRKHRRSPTSTTPSTWVTPQPRPVLVTSLTHFPITGSQAAAVVPFGNSAFTLVGHAHGSLGGSSSRAFPGSSRSSGRSSHGGRGADRSARASPRRRRGPGGCPRPRGRREPPDVHPAARHRPDPPARAAAGHLPQLAGWGPAPATCRPPPGSTWRGLVRRRRDRRWTASWC